MKYPEITDRIAQQMLNIEILEERGLDDLDFHDCHVTAIRDALAFAFETGKRAAKETR